MSEISVIVNKGDKFGRLTVIKEVKGIIRPSGKTDRKVLCKCLCGNKKVISLIHLRRTTKPVRSCGCLKSEILKETKTTHNLCNHPLYSVWNNIKRRTTDNPKNSHYRYYYGSGVRMCDEWKKDFKAFYDWAISNGYKEGLELDKDKLSPTKPGLLYSPEFCCFLTTQENKDYMRNSLTYLFDGEMLPINEISKRTGLSKSSLRNRIQYSTTPIDEIFKIGDRRKLGNNQKKLTKSQIVGIYKSTLPFREIILKFKVSPSTISAIKNKKRWADILNNI